MITNKLFQVRFRVPGLLKNQFAQDKGSQSRSCPKARSFVYRAIQFAAQGNNSLRTAKSGNFVFISSSQPSTSGNHQYS